MITDKIFISSSTSEEGKKSVSELINGLSRMGRKFDLVEIPMKKSTPTPSDKEAIIEKINKCGVTIFVFSSDFLTTNNLLLRKNNNGKNGWNYEELSHSLVWNKDKVHNSIIVTYTEKFAELYMKNPNLLSFPIINDNINNVNSLRSSQLDSQDYMEVISLPEFLSKPKFYLNKVDRRKAKQSEFGLYDLRFILD